MLKINPIFQRPFLLNYRPSCKSLDIKSTLLTCCNRICFLYILVLISLSLEFISSNISKMAQDLCEKKALEWGVTICRYRSITSTTSTIPKEKYIIGHLHHLRTSKLSQCRQLLLSWREPFQRKPKKSLRRQRCHLFPRKKRVWEVWAVEVKSIQSWYRCSCSFFQSFKSLLRKELNKCDLSTRRVTITL